VQHGTYVKVGKRVDIWFAVTLSTLGTITGAVQIQGLPFPSYSADAAYRGIVPINWTSLTTACTLVQATLPNNSSILSLVAASGATVSMTAVALAQADLSNTTRFVGAFTYLTQA
jgi:hypothetical protein